MALFISNRSQSKSTDLQRPNYKTNSNVFIFVYLLFENSNRDKTIEFESDIGILTELINESKRAGLEILITGDFNVDMLNKKRSKSHHTKLMNNFIKKNNLIIAETLFHQTIDHTFKNSRSQSSIDHTLVIN